MFRSKLLLTRYISQFEFSEILSGMLFMPEAQYHERLCEIEYFYRLFPGNLFEPKKVKNT